MFKVIRAGSEYNVVVVVTPADATPESTDAKFFQRQDWPTSHRQAHTFFEISRRDVVCAFSGQADGWGFAKIPDTDFASLEEVNAWILAEQAKP